ncbi:UrcA family protein [Novosphingobium jiangmenense]|uniref:UrcA family protein n=1 Tax=Novosphingobium jiangmenense TaxID=2791981 RepID=A0ABS0HGF3_9SPHN|nr:UrcA family protein [Novosphingobium jiangmenense]MBF9151317.1 UrcA family protein [Novosphingobium jiangmenense]
MFAKTLFSAGLLGLALSASQPAFAGTRIVGYTDLDLSTKEGDAQLNARLRKAAKDVCGLSQPDLPTAEWEAARQCFAKSYADARKAKSGIKEAALAAAKKAKTDLAVR